MTLENVKRLHEHFTFLAAGKWKENDFDTVLTARDLGESGRTAMGKMSPERIKLIKSDAKRYLEELEYKAKEINKLTGKPRNEFASILKKDAKVKDGDN